ncbi:MAG: hypothetical protein FWF08_01665 [Oscillospiraceae bacterium]|nr:hypothetical protein [Oscillospiraceae bacterium]
MKHSGKRNFTRILALFLCSALIFGGLFIAVSAEDEIESRQPSKSEQTLYNIGDKLVVGLLRCISAFIPMKFPAKYETGPDFYPGMDEFIDEPADGAKWSLGYARASVIPEGMFDPDTKLYLGSNDVYVGGSPKGEDPLRPVIDRKIPTRLIDDTCVRVTAIDDGSGRGTVIFASLDTYAITSYDIRIIRARLKEFAEENNIVSINIGMLHQHSAIDTFGYNGPLLNSLFLNPVINLFGGKPFTGKNPEFMEYLFEVVTDTVEEAVLGMEPGELYYGSASTEGWMYDRRAPYITDSEMHRLRFVPDGAGSRETWLLNIGVHNVGLDGDSQRISGDAPYYTEERVNGEYGANFQMILSGQLGVHKSYHYIDDGTQRDQIETLTAYGYALADYIADIDNEESVDPYLNIKSGEYSVPVDNPLHLLLLRTGTTQFTTVKHGFFGPDLDIITETGYMELGDSLAIGFGPGEIDPIIYLGGASTAAESYTGEDFIFTPMKDMVRNGRKFLMFGLMNDRSLYYVMPNDFQHFIKFGNEELNAMSVEATPNLLDAFKGLTDSVK